jgi:hypothetical protein
MPVPHSTVSTTRDVTPEEFAALIQKNETVAFIASGLSVGVYPSWPNLVGDLMEACGVEHNGDLSGATAEQLIDFAEHAWIANPRKFEERLHTIFGWPGFQGTRIEYQATVRLPFISFVTTNIEPCLIHEYQREHPGCGFFEYPNLPIRKLRDKAVFYLHGFAGGNDPPRGENIVLAKSAFDRAYQEGTELTAILREIFKYCSVVFIGCSLSEPQFDHIFERCRSEQDKVIAENSAFKPPEKWVLLPEFSPTPGKSEDQISRDKEAYSLKEAKLGAFGIKVMRYKLGRRNEHDALRHFLTQAAKISAPLTTNPFDPGASL